MKKALSTILAVLLLFSVIPTGLFSITVSAATTYSGYCGEEARWTFYRDSGVLEISGTGAISEYVGNYKYGPHGYNPWASGALTIIPSVKHIVISEGITAIHSEMFYAHWQNMKPTYFDSLESVTLPTTITYVSDSAFYTSPTVYVDNLKQWCEIGFRASNVFIKNEPLQKNVIIPEGTEKIDSYAFYCSNLSSVTIPVSVTKINTSAFSFCNNLQTVYYQGYENDYTKIQIDSTNLDLINAQWYYNSCIGSAEHDYESVCDAICDTCAKIRSVPGHIYDNACDTDCNECGADRTITHSYGEWITTNQPTCVENGSMHIECTICGVVLLTECIEKLGHDETVHDAKAPTCTDIGWHEYVTCSRCDYTTYNELAALGHDEVSHSAKAPTCTEIGWDAYVTCSRCDYTTYHEIAATGTHNLVGVVTKPTCTEQGYTTYICNMCGKSYVVYVDALGHKFDDDFDGECNGCNFTREAKKHGDITGDGNLNNQDLAILMQYINGWNVQIDIDAADVNNDGMINNKDYVLIMRHIGGWDVELK